MVFDPHIDLPGGFSASDSTIDFYARVNSLIRADMTVLDLGAGRAGWFEDDPLAFRRDLRLMKGKVAKVIAADVDSAVMENKAADECLIMTMERIPVEDSAVDLIISDYVLEHVANPDSFVREVNRVLKPGGWLCARTPHKFHMASLVAQMVPNRKHSAALKFVQPDRQERDVFPTTYKMNTLGDIGRAFAGYLNQSFVFKCDPAYYFGSKAVFRICQIASHVLPNALFGNVFVFVQKPGA